MASTTGNEKIFAHLADVLTELELAAIILGGSSTGAAIAACTNSG
ncbi:MAG: hypothetical protein WBW69_14205 [Candidatus Korobacteraceae bacterium]